MRHLALIKEVTEGTWKKRKLSNDEKRALFEEAFRLLSKANRLLDDIEQRLQNRK